MKANENIKIKVAVEVTRHDGCISTQTLFSSIREQGGTFDTVRDIRAAVLQIASETLKTFREQIDVEIIKKETDSSTDANA